MPNLGVLEYGQTVQQFNPSNYTITYHETTTNATAIEMYNYLRMIGIENNKFHLALYDRELLGVDPRDPFLNSMMKQRIFMECARNPWYYFREVLRLPSQGGSLTSGDRFRFDRGSLALLYCCINNYNIFIELPRQFGKTMTSLCWYSWVFLFGTTNSEILFFNKRNEDSKGNLARIKNIIELLPSYLQLSANYDENGKRIKDTDRAEALSKEINGNTIKIKASARNRVAANGLGRGCTVPFIYMDEYAFIPYNWIIWSAAIPAFSTASKNASKNGRPFGIIVSSTPGDLTTEEGKDAYDLVNSATKFNETWYDYPKSKVDAIIASNTQSSMVHIKFYHTQLGADPDYLKKMVVDMRRDWVAIRREVLLEWIHSSTNSPFEQVDLDQVQALCRDPIQVITLGEGRYPFNLYKKCDFWRNPPIIGVDVAGGYSKDSSAIVIIDSMTTEVIATFSCNYISIVDLGHLLVELVKGYMPNAVINIETNGGFGASVIEFLKSTSIKKNLYYEIKEQVLEERMNGVHRVKTKQLVKKFGFTETKNSRNGLMEILRERMDHHKDKFVCKNIFAELNTLEVKRNGRIEHASDAHDDMIFAMLMALHVWYDGQNIKENFNITKHAIKSEYNVQTEELINPLIDEVSTFEIIDDEIQTEIDRINASKFMTMKDVEISHQMEKIQAMNELSNTPFGKKVLRDVYNIDTSDSTMPYQIPLSVFSDVYNMSDSNIDLDELSADDRYNFNNEMLEQKMMNDEMERNRLIDYFNSIDPY